ncbi:hypothetical protein D3C72_119160 [compost metagenome]
MSTGPLGLTWVTQNPTVRPRGETPAAAAPEPPAQAPSNAASAASDQSLVTNGNALLLEWAGSSPTPGSAGAASGLGIEWASASNPPAPLGGSTSTPKPSGPPSSGGGLSLEWRSGSSSTPTTAPTTGNSTPAGGGSSVSNGLDLEWKSGTSSSTSAPAGGKPAGTPAAPPTSNPLGMTWVGGSGGATPAAPLDPEAQKMAQLKTQLTSPLPALPGPAASSNWKQNDLQNRANLIKAIRSDAALQTAFTDWDKLPNDVRLAAGTRIAAMEGAIYGFEPAPLQIDAFLKKPSYGYYHPTEDKVHISPDTLPDLREFVNTVTHEQAHAYQWEKGVDAKSGKMNPSDPLYTTAISWYENFFDYAQPNKGYEAYRTQPIEAHAFATGDSVAAGVFS